jgi:uncharacterized protein (TIGR03086 family)
LSIGDLARRTGLPVKLIRHWSDLGVVPPVERTAAGYRRFDATSVARLEFAHTLRELGLGMAAIRSVVDRERALPEVAAAHADALEVHILGLRLQHAVLRTVAARGSSAEELAAMTKLARLSAAERTAIIHRFVAETLGDLDVPTYRDGLLAAVPDLPADPTTEQVDAWLELAELIDDPRLRAAMRRTASYAARIAPGEHAEEDVRALRAVTDLWVSRVGAAMADGIAADSASADPIVAEIVAAWLPTQAGTADPPARDDAPARRRLLEQLELAADARAERYWQLVCVVAGRPAPPSLAAPGRWLITALRANPEPGARTAGLAALLTADGPDPGALLDACARVLAEVEGLVAAVTPDRFGDPTPCAGWDVRALVDRLVYENLLWTGLAVGEPRSDFAADHLGDDHAGAFRAAARATLAAFRAPGFPQRRYGPAPGWRLVEQVLIEMLVHGWDLAAATGRPTDLVPDVAEALLPAVRAVYGDLPRTPGGSFAAAHPVPQHASPADYLGRDPSWRRRPGG